MMLTLLLASSALYTATNFEPFVYQGSVCFSPDEASELLEAVQLRPLYEQKIILLSNQLNWKDWQIMEIDAFSEHQKSMAKKKNIRLFFMGASVGSGSTIAVLLVIIIKNAFF